MPLDAVCDAAWSEFGLRCDLVFGHSGPHVGENFTTGRIGYWGGRVAYVKLRPAKEDA